MTISNDDRNCKTGKRGLTRQKLFLGNRETHTQRNAH